MISAQESNLAKHPIPCVRIFLMNEKNEILLGKRTECNLYGLPGGKIEMFEEPEETAVRELKEETNISLQTIDFVLIKVKNIFNKEWGLHYVNFYYLAAFPHEQEIKNLEEKKTEDWIWMSESKINEKYEEMFWGLKQFAKDYGSFHEIIEMFKKL